jgi:hypothetical protein
MQEPSIFMEALDKEDPRASTLGHEGKRKTWRGAVRFGQNRLIYW